METKWAYDKKSHLEAEFGEMFMNTKDKEIMLIKGPYYAGGRSYYTYQTFVNEQTREKMILQQDFLTLRDQGKIFKVRIDSMDTTVIV